MRILIYVDWSVPMDIKQLQEQYASLKSQRDNVADEGKT